LTGDRLADGVTPVGEIDLDRLLLRFPHAVVAIGSDRRVAYANDSARDLFGEAAVRHGEELVDLIGDGELGALVERLMLAPSSVTETRMLTASGRALRVTGVTGVDEPAILVVEDVTAQHRHEQAVQEFVRNAAHQLRTPLTGVATAVEVLQSGAKNVPAERDRFLDHVARHTARLSRIARGLLALARTQSGEPLRLRPVQIEPMLARLAADAAPAPGVEVVAACAEDVSVLAEPDLLEEALAELVLNSIAHTQSGEIRLRATGDDGSVTIEVVDTGVGIAPEHCAHIFEPFYRPAAGRTGFGLGLAIVAEAVRAMDGRIEAVAAPRGAHLSITLPAAGRDG